MSSQGAAQDAQISSAGGTTRLPSTTSPLGVTQEGGAGNQGQQAQPEVPATTIKGLAGEVGSFVQRPDPTSSPLAQVVDQRDGQLGGRQQTELLMGPMPAEAERANGMNEGPFLATANQRLDVDRRFSQE